MSTALVIHSSEIPQFGSDPYGEMVAADKERKRRLEVVAWEAEKERQRIDRESRRHQEICRNVLQADKLIEAARGGRPRRMRVPNTVVDAYDGPKVIGPVTGADEARRYVHIVAHVTGVGYRQIFSVSREAPSAKARAVAMFVIHRKLGWSFPKLGRFFRRDHTTALAAVRRIEGLSRDDEALHTQLSAIKAALAAYTAERKSVAATQGPVPQSTD